MMRILLIGAAFILACHAQSQSPLDQITGLEKPVKIEAAMRPVSEVLADIGRQTGVNLSASPALQKVRVDVFVQGKSGRAALNAIATAVRAKWSNTSGLELQPIRYETPENVLGSRRSLFIAELNRLALSTRGTFESIINDVANISEQISQLQVSRPAGWQDRRMQLYRSLGLKPEVSDSFALFLTGRAVPNISQADLLRLAQGDTLMLTAPMVSPQDWRTLDENYSPPAQFMLVLQRRNGDLDIWSAARMGEFEMWSEQITLSIPNGDPTEIKLTDPSKATMAIKLPSNMQKPESKWSLRKNSASDHFLSLINAVGLSLVAESHRAAAEWQAMTPPDTVKKWLTTFQEWNGGNFGDVGGILVYMPDFPEFERAIDLDFNKLESGLKPGVDADLSDYVSFVTGLTALDRERLASRREWLVATNPQPLTTFLAEIRFMASLTADQFRLARQRRMVAFGSLSAVQKSLFTQALASAASFGNADMIPYWTEAGNPKPANPLAFFLDEPQYAATDFQPQPGVNVTMPTVDLGDVAATARIYEVNMSFGYSSEACVLSSFLLRRPATP